MEHHINEQTFSFDLNFNAVVVGYCVVVWVFSISVSLLTMMSMSTHIFPLTHIKSYSCDSSIYIDTHWHSGNCRRRLYALRVLSLTLVLSDFNAFLLVYIFECIKLRVFHWRWRPSDERNHLCVWEKERTCVMQSINDWKVPWRSLSTRRCRCACICVCKSGKLLPHGIWFR